MSNERRDYLKLSYAELEERNLKAKEQRLRRVPIGKIREKRPKYLTDEKRIKAVTGDVSATSKAASTSPFFFREIGDSSVRPGFFGRSKLARVWRLVRPRKSCLSGRFKVWIGVFSLRSARVRYSD